MIEGLLRRTDAYRRAGDVGGRLFDLIADPVMCVDEDDAIVLANRAFSDAFGPVIETETTIESIFLAAEARDEIVETVRRARNGGESSAETVLRTRSGRRCCYSLRCRSGETFGRRRVVVHFRDITETLRMIERLELLEFRDRKTGLPNRHSLDIILDKEIARVKRDGRNELLAVLFISLENIARINQTYGHEIGDILLENSGIRIKESIIAELLRESDYLFAGAATDDDGAADFGENAQEAVLEPVDEENLVFRFDGRELTAVLTGISRVTDAAVVATRIARNVSMPYRDKYGAEIYVNCNIGIAIYPNDGVDRETVIYHAASAMHEAKRLEEEFLLFNEALHARALEKMRLSGSIYTAFIESQFALYFQPVVDHAGKIVGAEALIRWEHPERGVISPGQFIPLAEEKGIIVNIGKWALYNACSHLSRWPEDIYVSINTSPRELAHAELIENVGRVLKKHSGLDPRRLKIEITERDAMKNPEDTIRRMESLVARGVEIFIDDFGIGNSSLSYLRRLPAATLKIDRSFVERIGSSEEERSFLESIIDLAKSRNKKVIVEGVETAEQVAVIRQMKPVRFQGYYFSRPVPAAEFESLIARRVRLPAS